MDYLSKEPCKVYPQKTIVQELTKSQKQIFDLPSILVPT